MSDMNRLFAHPASPFLHVKLLCVTPQLYGEQSGGLDSHLRVYVCTGTPVFCGVKHRLALCVNGVIKCASEPLHAQTWA